MIPKFTVRKEFYDELLDKSEETIEYFKRFEEPYDEFKNYGIAVYPNHTDGHLDKNGIGQFNEKYRPILDDWGYCPSEYALVQFLNKKGIVESIRKRYGKHRIVFQTELPTSVRASEAAAKGKSLVGYQKWNHLAKAYMELVDEVITNGQ